MANEPSISTCSGCGKTTPTWNIIDTWATDGNGGIICLGCQKKQKKGWYKPKEKDNDKKKKDERKR